MKKNLLLYIIVLILIPIFVVSIIYKSISIDELKKEKEIDIKNKNTLDSNIKIKINKNNEIKEINLEDYIVGVIAGEMPASFELEALKAQAVASRTYAMYMINNNKTNYDIESTVNDQVYITIEEMKAKWSEDFNIYYEKIKKAVYETKNLVMKKENQIFKSYYFAMSNGTTADSITVFKDTTSNSVESPWDNESLNKFIVTREFTLEELKLKLNLEKIEKIEVIKRDNTNRVEKIKVNNKTYTGIEFRQLLNLRSTDFTVSLTNNICSITTKGYGHGVGMSQYGANGMAKDNYTYDEILKHYYQNIEIEEI